MKNASKDNARAAMPYGYGEITSGRIYPGDLVWNGEVFEVVKTEGTVVVEQTHFVTRKFGLSLGLYKDHFQEVDCPFDECGEPIDFDTDTETWNRNAPSEWFVKTCPSCKVEVEIYLVYNGREIAFDVCIEGE